MAAATYATVRTKLRELEVQLKPFMGGWTENIQHAIIQTGADSQMELVEVGRTGYYVSLTNPLGMNSAPAKIAEMFDRARADNEARSTAGARSSDDADTTYRPRPEITVADPNSSQPQKEVLTLWDLDVILELITLYCPHAPRSPS